MKSRIAAALVGVILCVLTGGVAGSPVFAQGWELRVCADPDALPMSSRNTDGFENRIAEILADELGANLSYEWITIGPRAVRDHLHAGTCDLVMGAAEGADGLLNTVAYYRAPFVFVQRADAEPLTTFDDERIDELTFVIPPNGLEQVALQAYGRGGDAVTRPFSGSARGGGRIAPHIEAVLAGDADVAIVYGPYAARYVREMPDRLQMHPVAPELIPPMTVMYRTNTLGVRPDDHALRDRLNVALAERWDEIQRVLIDFGIPIAPSTRPHASAPSDEGRLRVGLVLPMPTGTSATTDVVARAARDGALFAESVLARSAANGPEPLVLLANAPGVEAAERAGRRLATTENADVLIGGVGSGQAAVLSRIAREQDLLFFNVGDPAQTLREACVPNTIHVAPSESMYLDATATLWSEREHRTVAIVHDSSDTSSRLAEIAAAAFARQTTDVATVKVQVPEGFGDYREAMEKIEEHDAHAVLVLLPPEPQEYFLSRVADIDLAVDVLGFPHARMQTREFLLRLRQVWERDVLERLSAWDPMLVRGDADGLSDRFAARMGTPMEAAAWAAYAALVMAQDAAGSGGSTADDMLSVLVGAEHLLDSEFSANLQIHRGSRQLLQPIILISVAEEARWGRSVQDRLDVVANAEPIVMPIEGDQGIAAGLPSCEP